MNAITRSRTIVPVSHASLNDSLCRRTTTSVAAAFTRSIPPARNNNEYNRRTRLTRFTEAFLRRYVAMSRAHSLAQYSVHETTTTTTTTSRNIEPVSHAPSNEACARHLCRDRIRSLDNACRQQRVQPSKTILMRFIKAFLCRLSPMSPTHIHSLNEELRATSTSRNHQTLLMRFSKLFLV